MHLGIDAGNNETKICGPYGVIKFPSDIGEYRERRLKQNFGPDDLIYEYKGKKGFAGTLARFESEYVGSMMGCTKAHDDALLRTLLAIHRYSDESNHKIVVGQPIEGHTEIEKSKIKASLMGHHTIIVNGEEKSFFISRVEVAAECGSGFWSSPRMGLIRILDVGSGTINGATLNDKRYIDKDSFTLNYGANTTKTFDLSHG